ncbi:MAG: ABC transporter permease subunit [Candidatus Cloacimonadales bacterium]|mgnify:CR=1 FL=1|jgi:ABC-2 type transport system permease protein|nr:ABC transporter permease subunit [Candidatus Cloacimonadota bacterium]MDD2650795.1 ABC transporter permease subunit [Candidatus Cloacimonadota bacterium]MDD3502333.1 ABC transporter permease subunit [Candidatus Cloacimonadota bacterium]MDX9977944.1 ABC transporter permease subunit [Candidatus Cloacimonadales bacterium]
MKQIKLIAYREFVSFFKSPTAYITLLVFTLINTWFFIMPLFSSGNATLNGLFYSIQLVWLVYIPVLSMGLIAKERNIGTIETLLTMPIKIKEIVLGKYMFTLLIILISLLLTLPNFITIALLGQNIDYGVIFCAYLGLFLIGSVYAAIGLFCSTINANQISAFILSFVLSLVLFLMEYALIFVPSSLLSFFQYFSITWQYGNISKGVLDSRVIVYFVSLVYIFLFFSIEYLKDRRSN